MARNGYLDRLRTVPAFCHCTHRQLQQVARLVDLVELPAGTVKLDPRELVITLDPVPALVVGRQALPVLLEIAPDLATRRPDQSWGSSRVGHNDCLFVSARACLSFPSFRGGFGHAASATAVEQRAELRPGSRQNRRYVS
jgi:hypothetical protein